MLNVPGPLEISLVIAIRYILDNIWYPDRNLDFEFVKKWKIYYTVDSEAISRTRSLVLTLVQGIYLTTRQDDLAFDQFLAVLFVIAGWFLYGWARLTLGPFAGRNIGILEDHILIETGPYRWFCHPMWFGELVATVASTYLFTLNTWIRIGSLLVSVSYYINNVKCEEDLFLGYCPGYEIYLHQRRLF